MIYEESEEIRITGELPPWQATYSWERFDGPIALTIDGMDVLKSCATNFDDLSETLVMVDQCKAYRKGHGAMVSKNGRMPIGAEIAYKCTHRFSNTALKVVKDFFIPRGVEVQQDIVIDKLSLDGGFKEYRIYSDDLEPGPWSRITNELSWQPVPLILCLKHETGLIIEIGCGNDVWRWEEGFIPDSPEPSSVTLTSDEQGLTLSRFGAQVVEATALIPRSFRFSWYMAWQMRKEKSGEDTGEVTLTHRPNGDVAMGALAKALEKAPGSWIVLDLETIPMPDTLKASGCGTPCLASNQTIKRLKRVIRQLSGLKTDGAKKLRFKNLRPAVCTVGSHVHGKDDRKHWDMNSILDFALWVRQALGDEWVFSNDAAIDLPSLTGAFEPTDHTQPPIQYEYTPEKP